MGCLVQRSRGQRVRWVVDAGEFQFSMGRKQVKTNCTKRPCFVRTDGHHSNVPEAPVGSTTITPIDPSSPDRPTAVAKSTVQMNLTVAFIYQPITTHSTVTSSLVNSQSRSTA